MAKLKNHGIMDHIDLPRKTGNKKLELNQHLVINLNMLFSVPQSQFYVQFHKSFYYFLGYASYVDNNTP